MDLPTDALAFASYWRSESRLFDVTGRWILEVDDPPLRNRIASWNQLHADHVDRWAARYPTIEELPPIEREDAEEPTGSVLDGPFDSDADRLTALAESALQPLVERYEEHRARVHPSLDGPTARTLALVLADTRAELAECRELLTR